MAHAPYELRKQCGIQGVTDITSDISFRYRCRVSSRTRSLRAVYQIRTSRSEAREIRMWEFHLAQAYFKIAVIAAGIAHRARVGAETGQGFATAGDAIGTYPGLGLRTLGKPGGAQ